MICPNCKTTNRFGGRFCAKCGSVLFLTAGTLLHSQRYKIVRELSYGRFGADYLIEDLSLKKTAILKEIPNSVNHLWGNRLASLRHPNLVRVYDYFEENQRQCLILEFVHGEKLDQILENTQDFLPEELLIEWAIQLCGVLAYLHTQNPRVIIRNLTPENLMVDNQGKVILVDVGFDSLVASEIITPDTLKMGTNRYTAPELFKQRGSDPRSDIYSLGAILHHLVTKNDPNKESPFYFPNAPVQRYNPKISSHFSQIIAKATAIKIEDRISTISEMREELEICLNATTYEIRREFGLNKIGPTMSNENSTVAKKIFIGRIRPSIKELLSSFFQTSKDPKPQKLFAVSASHPKTLSKRYTSAFLVQMYLAELQFKVAENVRKEFGSRKSEEHVQENIPLSLGQVVKIKLFHPEITFSEPVVKNLDQDINVVRIVGKPQDRCHPGKHQIILTITDEKSGVEYVSLSFQVQITDYVFDHVSRPLLSNLMTGILAIGSFVMYILTFMGQVDSTLGYTSGTTAGALASVIYLNFFSAYKRSSTSGIEKVGSKT